MLRGAAVALRHTCSFACSSHLGRRLREQKHVREQRAQRLSLASVQATLSRAARTQYTRFKSLVYGECSCQLNPG